MLPKVRYVLAFAFLIARIRCGSIPLSISLQSNPLLCLDLSGGSTANGNFVEIWDCNGLDNQAWFFDAGSYKITYALHSNKCVDAGLNYKAGGQLMIWDCNGQPQQKWGYDPDQSTIFLLDSSSDASFCMDAYTPLKSGNNVQVWDCNGLPQQKFDVLPVPASTCTGGWPLFSSAAQLHQNKGWAKYFQAVYGAVPQNGYPICVGHFSLIYHAELSKSGAKPPMPATSCFQHRKAGEYFTHNNNPNKSWPGAFWILHLPPFKGLSKNEWVEVTHHNFNPGEKHGAWFYYAKGSGLWFNLGKTIVFGDHPDSGKHFGCGEVCCIRKAASEGYDSIQFTNHGDVGTCPQPCCKHWKLNTINIEIVGTKLVGDYACTEVGGNKIRAGWMGHRSCHCVEQGHHYLNCQGVPSFEAGLAELV